MDKAFVRAKREGAIYTTHNIELFFGHVCSLPE